MSIHKFRKIISVLVSLTLTGTMMPCGAANLVPFNGVKPVVTPAVPVTKPIVEQKNSSNDFSIQSIKSKISDILNPKKDKTKLQETYSGSCGDNVTWELDTNTGVLNITGTGSMWNYENEKLEDIPWYSFKDSIKQININNGVENIGDHIFKNCGNLKSISIPNSVKSIGLRSFESCISLNSITIPTSVISIGNAAFGSCFALESITIPDSVDLIRSWTFGSCSALKSISIPNTVTSIEEWAFNGCTALESISIPNNVTTIERHTFHGCSALKSISIPNNVTTIKEYAFYQCTSLESISIPDSVTYIGDHAFSCTALKSVTIPNSVTFIDNDAFSHCTALGSVTIPTSVTNIGLWAFSGCSSLTSINVSSENPNYKGNDGVLFTKDGTRLIQYPNGNSRTFYEIPNFVTTVGDAAFWGCEHLTSITIPNSVTSIERVAFQYCGALESIFIPNSVTSIGASVLESCGRLKSVILGNGINSLGDDHTIQNCSALEYITLGNNFEVSNFRSIFGTNFNNLKEIKLADGITSIQNNSFAGCDLSHSKLILLSSIDTIESDAFKDCVGLNSIVLNNDYCINNFKTFFNGLNVHTVEFGDNITSIGSNAFNDCTSLTEIAIPANVANIGEGAFYGCSNLEHITLSSQGALSSFSSSFNSCKDNAEIEIKDVESIPADSFNGCAWLNASIIIPTTVTSIGTNAFEGCSNLTEINLPFSISEIGTGAFHGCSNLEHITLSSEGALSNFSSSFNSCKDNAEIEIKDVESIPAESFNGCAWLNASIIIPTTVTSIGANAFNGCSNLTEINLPSSISEIGAGAFHGCSNLGHITLSSEGALSSFSSSFNSCKDNAEIEIKDVESIPAESFNGCAWLNASIIIPTTVTKIGANAFNGCSKLAEINLPSNVSNIENAAFYGCSNLEHITLSSEEALSSFRSSFDSCKDNAKIEIKDVKSIPVESFKGCSWLKEVSIDIPTTVTNIGDNAFEGCSGLTELYIPASVVNIGNCVFDNCTNLSKIDVDSNNKIYKSLDGFLLSKDSSKLIRCLEGKKGSVKLPDNVDSISSYAFSGCKKLSSVTMNENLKTISEYAFKNCTGLTSINIPSSVTEIGDGVFSGCTNITSATLNNSDVLEKFKSIFMNCSNLNTVIIGNSVDTIPDNTFNGWSNLNSISIGDNVVLIGDSAFSDCVKLSTVTIPSKVSLIYRSAFSGCKELTNVNIFGDLNYVGQEAFADCTKLNNFTYQGTRAPLYDDPGKNVFSNCPLLEKVSVPKDYKGSTFCGHQTTKGKSAKEKFDENIGWWLSSIGLVLTVLTGFISVIVTSIKCPNVVKDNKDWWINHCNCCHHNRDLMSEPLPVEA